MNASKKSNRKDAATARRDAATDKAVAMTADLLRTLESAHEQTVALARNLSAYVPAGVRPECFGRTPLDEVAETLVALAYNIDVGLMMLHSVVTTEVHLARWSENGGSRD